MIIKEAVYRNTVIPTITKGLDAATLRDKAISNNLANVNTPGYRRIEVKFEEELQKALKINELKGSRTHLNHLPNGKKDLNDIHPIGYRSEDPTNPGEINNVDIDIEASKLAENNINFNYVAKFMKFESSSLLGAIKGRPV